MDSWTSHHLLLLFFESIVLLLPPVNFTIKATGLAQVRLHWDPNPDQEQSNFDLQYHVKINAPQEDDVSVGSNDNHYGEWIFIFKLYFIHKVKFLINNNQLLKIFLCYQ